MLHAYQHPATADEQIVPRLPPVPLTCVRWFSCVLEPGGLNAVRSDRAAASQRFDVSRTTELNGWGAEAPRMRESLPRVCTVSSADKFRRLSNVSLEAVQNHTISSVQIKVAAVPQTVVSSVPCLERVPILPQSFPMHKAVSNLGFSIARPSAASVLSSRKDQNCKTSPCFHSFSCPHRAAAEIEAQPQHGRSAPALTTRKENLPRRLAGARRRSYR